MSNKTIHDFPEISGLTGADELLIWDTANATTNKVTVSAIAALVSTAVVPVNASNVAAAGALMTSYVSGSTGFVYKNSSTDYAAREITSNDVGGLGTLATQNNVATGQVSGLGQLATVLASVTAAAASTYLMYNGTSWIPTSITQGGGGVTKLIQLTDVSVTSAANGQVLTFNSFTSSWIPTSVTGGGGGTVDASSIAAAGGILDSQFTGLGYVTKTGTQAFVEVCTIPASDITGLGVLATTSTVASAQSYLNLNTLATTSTQASAKTYLGITAFGSQITSATNAAAAGTLLNLGTLATTSTQASAQSYLNMGTLATTSTAASGISFLGLGTLATTSTAASGRTFLALGQLATVTASVTSATASSYLMYNGTSWIPVSITSGGGSTTLAGLSDVSIFTPGTGQILTYDAVQSKWINGSGVGALAYTSTVASAQSYLNMGTLATTSTAASGISFLGLGVLATTSTAASGRSFLGLGQLATVTASVTAAAASTYLMYNGTSWIPTSITSGGSTQLFAGVRALTGPTVNVSSGAVTLACTSVVFDSMSGYNTTTGHFTPNIAGYYYAHMRTQAQCATSASQLIIGWIGLNGGITNADGAQSFTAPTSAGRATIDTGGIYFLNGTTDYITPIVGGGPGPAITYTPQIFEAFLIGTTQVTVVPGASKLIQLSDVSVTAATNNQVLTFNAASSSWIPTSAASGGSTTLAGLTDVSLASLTTGKILTYDATQSKWLAGNNVGALAYTSTVASAQSYLDMGVLATVSTQASAAAFLNLGTLATTSTAASGITFLGLGALATTSTAASGRSFLALGQLATVTASVTAAAASSYLMYNGTSWIGVSITAGGGSTTLAGLSDVSLGTLANGQLLTYDVSNSKWIGGANVGALAYTSTVASAQSYLNLGTLATVSTAASGATFLNLGVLATTSTAASARTFAALNTTDTPQFARVGLGVAADASAAMVANGYYYSVQVSASGGVVDWSRGNVQTMTYGAGANNLVFSGAKSGMRGLLIASQPGTGTLGSSVSVSSTTGAVLFQGGTIPTPTAVSGKADIYGVVYAVSTFYITQTPNF